MERSREELDAMDIESLEQLRIDLETDIARIKGQVDTAKAKAQDEGVYADAKWFNAARHALRMKGVEHQALLRLLSQRRRDDRAYTEAFRQKTRERLFIDLARARLDPETYRSLWAEVEAGVASSGSDPL